MFEKFGEMSSYEEINELAENLLNEGDMDSLKEMAAENGIQEGFVNMYLRGNIPALCDAMTAAVGKIEVECEDLKPQEIMEDWVRYIKAQCMDSEELARSVRKKGKTLKGCIAALLKWSFSHQQPIDRKIVEDAGVKAGRVTLGIPGMGRAKKIIREYYLGGKKK